MKYAWADPETVHNAVEAGIAGGARRVCMVASGHGPSSRDVDRVNAMVRDVKSEHPNVEVCVCMGFVDKDKAESIKEAGAASVYSSVEAANAAEELVKAGVSAQDVIGGGLTGALGLAAAGGIGLARAAEVSAMAMTQFKLGGEDATHIADVLAGGALASTASVDSLAMALAQGGGVANQFGAHLEDTVGTLAMFDQNALRGSDAGTSMKTMLLSLANPSKAAAAAMRNLGINAFTAQGEFVGLAGLQDQLKEKTKGLTQEQRQQAFATIFGSDAVRAANAMYGDTKGIRAWTESVNKSGLASQVAAAKLNNAKGDLEALKGDLENILIGAGEGANGPIRGLIQNVDKLVSAFGELPSGVQSGVVQIAAFGSAGLLAAAGVIKMVNTIRSIRSSVMTATGALRDGVGAFTSWVRAGSSSGTMLAGLRGRAVQAGNAIRNMGIVGKVGLGLLAAGFIAAGVAAATSGREVENYGRQTSRLGLDLQSAAKGGAGLNDIFKDMSVAAAKDSSMSFAEGMRSLKGATNEATDGVDRFAAGIFKQTGLAKGALGPIDAVKGRLEGVGRHLADLANNGNMAEASAQFKVLTDEAKKYGVSQDDLIRMMPEWSAVLDSSAYKQQSATEKAKADEAARQKQKESLDQLISAYKNLNNVLLQQEAGQDAALAAVDAADKALQENGRTLEANSEKGRANRSALRDIVQQYGEWASSVKQATGSSEQANAILAQGKKAYIDHAVSMGKSADEAKRLANELFKVGEVDTTADVTVDGVKAAQYEVDEFGFDENFTTHAYFPLLRLLYRHWFRVEVRGIENIPADSGALIVSNHSGTVAIDSLMTQLAVHDETPNHRFLRMLGADLVFRTPVLSDVARKTGATLATNPDATRLLSGGHLVGVWPEGFKGVGKPFSERYKLQRFGRGGFVSAALRSQVPIVPCSVVGAEEAYPMIGNLKTVARIAGLPYAPVTPTFPLLGPLGMIPLPSKWIIEFGEPVDTASLGPAAAEDPMLVFELTDQVRETIQQTLYSVLVTRRSVFF